MKKALVLGVLAFFAISIANVNAQDRTNVQEKPKKTYTQEPAAKNVDTKAINETKKVDPTSKQVTPTPAPVKGKQLPKNPQKNAVDKKAVDKNAEVIDVEAEKKAAELSTSKTTGPKKVSKNDAKKVNGNKINNSVPPTPKTTKTAGEKAPVTNNR